MANHLTTLANRWKTADSNDELPEALYDALVGENNTAYERRVIKALARATRIVNDDGTIRNFAELVEDWEYSHSVYGHTKVCGACGKKDIVQNCILKNKHDSSELIVGSTCVFRYMEIIVNGRTLTGEEKEEWLRLEMNKAKAEFRRQMFMGKHPNVMELLDRYEPLTGNYNRWGQRRTYRYRHNPVEKLFKAMGKRMVKFGFPGPTLEHDWEAFLTTAEERLTEHNKFMEEATRELEERQAAARELQDERDLRWEREKNEREIKRAEDRQAFLDETESLVEGMNDWEQNARSQIAERISKGTPLRGYTRTVAEWRNRIAVLDGGEVVHPMYKQLEELDESKLNAWEQKFRTSIMNQLASGRDLSPKQASTVTKVIDKHASKAAVSES